MAASVFQRTDAQQGVDNNAIFIGVPAQAGTVRWHKLESRHEQTLHSWQYAGVRLLAALVMVASLTLASAVTLAADRSDITDRTEQRIQDMHVRLGITAMQEAQWGKVAQIMRDDANTIDALVVARMEHSRDMTAIDDLKSYGEIAAAHLQAIQRLIPVFAVLYDDMSENQRLAADKLFRHGERMLAQRQNGRKAPLGR